MSPTVSLAFPLIPWTALTGSVILFCVGAVLALQKIGQRQSNGVGSLGVVLVCVAIGGGLMVGLWNGAASLSNALAAGQHVQETSAR